MNVKYLLLLVCFLTLSVAVSAQTVAEVQQSLITKRTATWCPHCGTWGWTFFESLQTGVSDKAVLVAAHFGGSSLENPTSIAWVNNMGSSSQPKFFVNNELQNVTSSNGAAAYLVVKDKVESLYQSAPLANVGLETAWNGSNLDIKTKTVFFQNGSGDFYLGLYLVEDEVMASQAAQTGIVAHHGILRASATSTTFGELVASGAVASGAEFSKTYTVSPSAYNIDNLDVMGVIWKKEGNTYQVVNVWSVDAKPAISSAYEPDLSKGIQATVRPNIFSGGEQCVISIALEESDDLVIEVVDIQGRVTSQIFSGRATAGLQQYTFDSGQIKVGGWYALRIVGTQGKSLSIPLYRQ